VELPEVQEGVEEIARLREEIRQTRIRIEELERDPGPPALPPPADPR
jgi:DNA-binding PadR family transcriptional regulator